MLNLGVDNPITAVVAIDLHRGHLDITVTTMPTTPEIAAKVIAANQQLFTWWIGWEVNVRTFDPRNPYLNSPMLPAWDLAQAQWAW